MGADTTQIRISKTLNDELTKLSKLLREQGRAANLTKEQITHMFLSDCIHAVYAHEPGMPESIRSMRAHVGGLMDLPYPSTIQDAPVPYPANAPKGPTIEERLTAIEKALGVGKRKRST